MSKRLIQLGILGLVAVFTIAACSTDAAIADPVQTVSAATAVAILDERTVIDVRTPAEYAEAHIDGAINIDVQASDFAERIAALDPGQPYLVYCRSGRRSAVAADEMAAAGFSNIVDAGGLADLAKAGAPIVS